MIAYTLALLAATTQAVSIRTRTDAHTTQEVSPCYNTGALWDAQEDGDETLPFYDFSDRSENLEYRGALHGYYDHSKPFWDVMNADNDCEYPEFDLSCTSETGHTINPNAFEMERWGLLNIFPAMLDNDGADFIEAECTMSVYFEHFPLDKKSRKYDTSPPENVNYWTRGHFKIIIGYNQDE